jgi:hypothetical protein
MELSFEHAGDAFDAGEIVNLHGAPMVDQAQFGIFCGSSAALLESFKREAGASLGKTLKSCGTAKADPSSLGQFIGSPCWL